MEQRPKKLIEQVQDVIRLKHYSYQTEKTYDFEINLDELYDRVDFA